MPRRALTPCTAPGCPQLTPTSRCRQHNTRTPDTQRPSAARRGYDHQWTKRRNLQLSREPLCRHCRAQGTLTPAIQVDHITPRTQGGTDHPTNLQSLCASCHARKTHKEQHQQPRHPPH